MRKKILILTTVLTVLFIGSAAQAVRPGEIVFTENPGEPVSRELIYQIPDDLYMKVMLEKPLAATYDSLKMLYNYSDEAFTFNYALRFYAGGEEKDTWLFEMPSGDFRSLREIDYALSTSNKELKRRSSYTVNNWVDLISSLGNGAHQLRVEFLPLNTYNLNDEVPVLADGIITVRIDPAKLESFREKRTNVLPPPTAINEKIQEQIAMASDGIYPNLEPIQVIITDVEGDWSYGTDELGNIIRRYIIASVLYRNRMQDYCELRSGVYFQEHNGYGIFGETRYLKPATGYYEYSLPCEPPNME